MCVPSPLISNKCVQSLKWASKWSSHNPAAAGWITASDAAASTAAVAVLPLTWLLCWWPNASSGSSGATQSSNNRIAPATLNTKTPQPIINCEHSIRNSVVPVSLSVKQIVRPSVCLSMRSFAVRSVLLDYKTIVIVIIIITTIITMIIMTCGELNWPAA